MLPLMSSRTLNRMRESSKKMMKREGLLWRFLKRWEEHAKGMFMPSTLFEELGFHYTGPIDGHDLPQLVQALGTLKELKGPQLLHVITTKGKGYAPAERDQIDYHAVGPFDPDKGLAKKNAAKPTYTEIFGDWLCDQAQADSDLYAITPAMREGSGLVRYSREWPARYFDVGIAEQHAVTLAAGMACEGAKPVVAIYSTFCSGLRPAHPRCCPAEPRRTVRDDRGGVSDRTGRRTRAASICPICDASDMIVMAPADENECRQMLSTGFQYRGPAAVRYPRGNGPGVAVDSGLSGLPIGKAELRLRGQGLALLAFGAALAPALKVGEILGATVVNMRFVKPLDEALILELARNHVAFVTLEDNAIAGGAGSGVAELLAAHGIALPILHLGLADTWLEHASREELLAESGLDAASIESAIRTRFAGFIPVATMRSAG